GGCGNRVLLHLYGKGGVQFAFGLPDGSGHRRVNDRRPLQRFAGKRGDRGHGRRVVIGRRPIERDSAADLQGAKCLEQPGSSTGVFLERLEVSLDRRSLDELKLMRDRAEAWLGCGRGPLAGHRLELMKDVAAHRVLPTAALLTL